MGQYFMVINIDKKQKLRFLGASKLGEFLFDGSPNELVGLLTETGAWNGDRVVCVGDYIGEDDLPPGCLTDAEEAEVKAADSERRTLYHFASKYYAAAPRGWHGLDLNTTYVLRNLTKHEYVLEGVVCRYEMSTRGYFGQVGLGEVLLARISWSSDPSVSMFYNDLFYEKNKAEEDRTKHEGIHRGVWAGDRFDIIPIDEMEHLDGFAEWKDVSDEVDKEIDEIWTCQCGDEYTKELARTIMKHGFENIQAYLVHAHDLRKTRLRS
ncbi:hypothetical protein FIBSPDRAFT_934453 [Athelia psychrophila]|uniref:Uncharacterized protein n=1 Tax=Athelia psychrophila TaxID=1759441 RepID=A0A166FDM8_9AGAM|nr:hypothetical protein FIBSPDRAFT_934453 [Fibularhizoctonia sp. CBS 109695]